MLFQVFDSVIFSQQQNQIRENIPNYIYLIFVDHHKVSFQMEPFHLRKP